MRGGRRIAGTAFLGGQIARAAVLLQTSLATSIHADLRTDVAALPRRKDVNVSHDKAVPAHPELASQDTEQALAASEGDAVDVIKSVEQADEQEDGIEDEERELAVGKEDAVAVVKAVEKSTSKTKAKRTKEAMSTLFPFAVPLFIMAPLSVVGCFYLVTSAGSKEPTAPSYRGSYEYAKYPVAEKPESAGMKQKVDWSRLSTGRAGSQRDWPTGSSTRLPSQNALMSATSLSSAQSLNPTGLASVGHLYPRTDEQVNSAARAYEYYNTQRSSSPRLSNVERPM